MEEERTQLTEVVYRSLSLNRREQILKPDSDNDKKTTLFLYISAIVASLIIFTVASGFSWTSSVLQMLKSNDPTINPLGAPVNPIQESWIASLYALGAGAGPLIAGKLSDILGRKNTLLIISIPKLICLLTLCFATDIRLYYICRFIMGLVLGTSFAVVPVYLIEISEVHNRGTISSFIALFLNMGVLYCIVLGPLLSIKFLTFFCAIPLLLFVILFSLYMPETPVFLVSKGNINDAVKVLQKLRGRDDVQKELQEISKNIEAQRLDKKAASDFLKDRGLRKALVVGIVMVVGAQMSGINPIVAFLEGIVKASGSNISAHLSTNVIGILQVLATIITSIIAEKFRRKVILITSLSGIIFSHVIATTYFFLSGTYNLHNLNWLPIACLVSFVLSFNLGLSSLSITVMSEVFPHSVKAVGASIATCCGFLSSFIITLSFRIIFDIFGLSHCFLSLCGLNVVLLIFIYFFVPETKGKSEAEIQKLLRQS